MPKRLFIMGAWLVFKVLFTFLLVATLLTSCNSSGDNAVPGETNIATKLSANGGNSGNDNIWEEKSDWMEIPGISTNYVKLDDINPDAVPEIKLGFSMDAASYIFKETAGGLLCGKMGSPEISSNAQDVKKTPQIRKLDKTGKMVWKKDYDYQTHSGNINNLVASPDGSFIFSVQTYPYVKDTGLVWEKSCLIKCDQDGKELWRRDFDDYAGGLLRHLFITENDEVIAVGEWRSKNGRQTKDDAADDLVVTRLDKNGNVLQQKGFGGSDFDSLKTAEYDRELGIIINGRTQSSDGDFAISMARRSADFIACIDESLNLQWVVHAKEKENFVYDQLALSKGFVYILGNYAREGDTPVDGFLLKVDTRGKRVWTKARLHTGLWGRVVSVLPNGAIAIGAGQRNQGVMLILDENGNEKKRLEDLKFTVNKISPTADGGFIATAVREIKTVPQPPVISSIWYDTELVAIKYKSDYTIEWRKTYDKYKDKKGSDFAFPLSSGKLIVEP